MLSLSALQSIPADKMRVKISPVFECLGLTSQLWTYVSVRVSQRLAFIGNVLNYCSKFPAINFYSFSDKTIELAMSMIDYKGEKTDHRYNRQMLFRNLTFVTVRHCTLELDRHHSSVHLNVSSTFLTPMTLDRKTNFSLVSFSINKKYVMT